MTNLRIAMKSCFFSCINCFRLAIIKVFHSCNLQNSAGSQNHYVLRISWIHQQCQLHRQKKLTILWFSIIIININVRIFFSMFTFTFLILFSFSILFTFTLTFSNFFTFTFSIHTTFMTFILHLLTDFTHFMITIKTQSVDEISFTYDSSIYSGLFFCLNFQISEKNFLHECLILFKNAQQQIDDELLLKVNIFLI